MDFYSNTYMQNIPSTPAIENIPNGYICYPYANTTNLRCNEQSVSIKKEITENTKLNDLTRNSALQEAIASIKKSIEDEKDDEIFYEILLSQAPSEKDKKILQSIISDERKHNSMLKQLYKELTKEAMPNAIMSRSSASSTEYLKNLEKALFSELTAVEKYRKIMAAMPDKEKYAMIMEIMTDEFRHAHKYNFLITKNMK